MSTATAVVMEFHLSRELPKAAGFATGLSGVALLFFAIAFAHEGAPALLGVVGALLLLLSIVCFTFKKVVRMDKRTGKIETILSMFLWRQTQRYSVSDFAQVGIGMGGNDYIKTSTRYFVQLLGPTNLNIPGTSSNKEAIVALAGEVGDYLDLPVEREPKLMFFQKRL
jgi:hypothetical protein